MCHFVETEDLDAATNLVRLFHIANPGVVPSVEAASNDFKLIQVLALSNEVFMAADLTPYFYFIFRNIF